MTLGARFEREIYEQPDTLARLLAEGRSEIERIAARVTTYAPRTVLLAGRGSSDNAARYAQYLFAIHNRLAVGLCAPSTVTLYGVEPELEGTLVIGVSQSGQSPDIVTVVEAARRRGALTVAITTDRSSPLGEAADECFELKTGVEQAVAASKTYTNQLMALAMLSTALDPKAARWGSLSQVANLVEQTLRLNVDVDALTVRFRYAERFAVVSRGLNYATAFEAALKLKETTYLTAEPYSSADFRHGPIAVVDRGFPVFLIAPTGQTLDDSVALIDELDARGAELVAVSDDERVLERARAPLPLPTGIPEWLSPIAAVIPAQLWALSLARTRGIDPDQPRGLAKVTRTR